MEDGRIAGDQSRFPQKDWNERRRLKDLPIQMAERAKLARLAGAADPTKIELDDEFCPWIWVEQEGVWISFDGNYSAKSPSQKRQDYQERKERRWQESVDRLGAQFYWDVVRRDVLKRDMNTCQICGAIKPTRLHVHHIQKRRLGGGDFKDNLITVCPSCHRAADTEDYDPDWRRIPDGDPYYYVVADSYDSLAWHAVERAKQEIIQHCEKFAIDISDVKVLRLCNKPTGRRFDSISIEDIRDRYLRGVEVSEAQIAKAYEKSMRSLVNEIAWCIASHLNVHQEYAKEFNWLSAIELNLRDILDVASEFETFIAELKSEKTFQIDADAQTNMGDVDPIALVQSIIDDLTNDGG